MVKGTIYKRGKQMSSYKVQRAMGHKRKSKRVVKNRTTVPVGLGFPKKMIITHKYGDTIALNTLAAGALQAYNFSCNSLFKPDQTNAGHQPMYFDQMAALYDHYTVIGSKITVRISHTSSGAALTIPITCGIFVNDDATVTPSILGLMENSLGFYKQITGANPTTVLTKKWSAKKYFGGSVLANDDLEGTAAASPVEQSVFTIFLDSSPLATQTSVVFDVDIRYIAVWKELRDIATS